MFICFDLFWPVVCGEARGVVLFWWRAYMSTAHLHGYVCMCRFELDWLNIHQEDDNSWAFESSSIVNIELSDVVLTCKESGHFRIYGQCQGGRILSSNHYPKWEGAWTPGASRECCRNSRRYPAQMLAQTGEDTGHSMKLPSRRSTNCRSETQ